MEDNYDISNLKKKKKINSRTKGSSFERTIAAQLNDRFKTTEFSRTPGSGAFASTHKLPDHLKIHGDLITPRNFKYCIECKKGYNKESLNSLLNNSSELWNFIEQCQKDSDKAHKLPLIIFKQDRQPTLAVVPYDVGYKSNNYVELHKQDRYYRMYLFDEILAESDSIWLL
jgi:Holliday junction resolvase